MDQRRCIRLLDLLTQVADVDIQKVVVAEEVLAPDATHDVLSLQNGTSPAHQEIQQVVFLDRQVNGPIASPLGSRPNDMS